MLFRSTALNARAVQRIIFVNLSTRRVSVDYSASNAALTAAAQRYPNISVLDWNTYSAGAEKTRWFSDTVHLSSTGRAEFALFLRNQLDELRRAGLISAGSGAIIPMSVPMVTGERGEPVKALQAALNTALGLKKKQKLALDGTFGKGTEKAVAAFETQVGLPVDGIAERVAREGERERRTRRHREDRRGCHVVRALGHPGDGDALVREEPMGSTPWITAHCSGQHSSIWSIG